MTMRLARTVRLCLAAGLAACGGLVAGCAPSDQETDGPEPVGEAVQADTVSQAANNGCSTLSVKGLSEQIVAQSNCISPGAFVKLPSKPNLDLAATVFPYLEEPARDALVEALAAKSGTTLSVNSMLRTVAQQYLLYQWDQTNTCGIQIAATPGNSNHETGLAFDTSDYTTWKATLENHGFKWYGSGDVVHFDYVGPGAKNYKGTDVLAFQQLWNMNHPADKIAEDGAYGPQTETKLKGSPADGFPIGADCSAGNTPDVHPSIALVDAEDRFTDASSKDVADLFVGETYSVVLEIANKGQAPATTVDVGISIEDPYLAAGDYVIESDWMHPGTFSESDANAEPSNPPHDGKPGQTFTLKMNQLSPGETKRVTLTVSAASYSIGPADAPAVDFWVEDIPDFYHQDEFGGDATNKDGSQKFNGGKLEVALPTDVYSRTRWEWDSDRLEGWAPLGSATLTADAKAKALLIDGSGKDPGAQGPETEISAADHKTVTLRAKRSGGTGGAKLYFATAEDPTMSDDKAIDVDLPDGEATAEIEINAAEHPKWKGTITAIRFDPFEAGPGTAELDSLHVGQGDAPGPVGPLPGTAPEDASGCACNTAGAGTSDRLASVLALLAAFGWRRGRRRSEKRQPC